MIVDNLKNASLYYGMSSGIEKALKYLQEQDFSKMAPGKYEICGQDLFAIVQEYDARPRDEKSWEAHKRYIDVQYIAAGNELMGYAEMSTMDSPGDYDAEKDFSIPVGDGDFLVAPTGTFFILYPHDVHKPCCCISEPEPVKKVVVKVKVA